MDSWCFPPFDPEPVKQTDDVHRPSATVIPIFLHHNGGGGGLPIGHTRHRPKTRKHSTKDAATWERHMGETRAFARRHHARSPYHDREEHRHTYIQSITSSKTRFASIPYSCICGCFHIHQTTCLDCDRIYEASTLLDPYRGSPYNRTYKL
ncbi:hypothetical protein FOWG_01500 [Fusarium oxysporum f. sp. lycopersici MN25]|nr:hypothetical protein FOWG_01500 [Fusarium oxysporum f. sp. lycopersici MN25]